MVVTLIAAVVLIVGGMMVAGKVKPAAEAVIDQAGVGAAVALAVIEPEWWDVEHGVSQPAFYEMLEAARDQGSTTSPGRQQVQEPIFSVRSSTSSSSASESRRRGEPCGRSATPRSAPRTGSGSSG